MYYAIVCQSCECEHVDVYDSDNKLVEGDGQADAHGAWASGKGDTPQAAKEDALAAIDWEAEVLSS